MATKRFIVEGVRCSKVAFPSREDAKRAQDSFSRNKYDQDGNPVVRIRPYSCKHCGQWHLTSKTKAELRAARRAKRKAIKVDRELIKLLREEIGEYGRNNKATTRNNRNSAQIGRH